MNRLFVYGTLCPGRENAHILQPIAGTWAKGSVHGVVHILDWGPDQGLPAIVLDSEAPKVQGYLFTTEKLVDHWARIDDFEGPQYERVPVQVELESGEQTQAWIYVMKEMGSK